MKPPPPEPRAVLWSLVTTGSDGRFPVRPGWWRVHGGTPEQMAAELDRRREFAEQHGHGSWFAVTGRGADGRCPRPGSPEGEGVDHGVSGR